MSRLGVEVLPSRSKLIMSEDRLRNPKNGHGRRFHAWAAAVRACAAIQALAPRELGDGASPGALAAQPESRPGHDTEGDPRSPGAPLRGRKSHCRTAVTGRDRADRPGGRPCFRPSTGRWRGPLRPREHGWDHLKGATRDWHM